MDTWVLVWFLAAVAMGLYLGVNRDRYRRAKQKAGAAKAKFNLRIFTFGELVEADSDRQEANIKTKQGGVRR
ncbi:hypothetical protein CF326_g613 [Tilletia indica]|nr:hypothetical protein CF326_g613 [Tilletia indica]